MAPNDGYFLLRGFAEPGLELLMICAHVSFSYLSRCLLVVEVQGKSKERQWTLSNHWCVP